MLVTVRFIFPSVCICIWGGGIPLRTCSEELRQLCSPGRAALCFSVSLLKRQRRMSRKGTRGYTGPRRTALTLRAKSAPVLSLPNGFCYQYILLNLKGSLTICASDLNCRKKKKNFSWNTTRKWIKRAFVIAGSRSLLLFTDICYLQIGFQPKPEIYFLQMTLTAYFKRLLQINPPTLNSIWGRRPRYARH